MRLSSEVSGLLTILGIALGLIQLWLAIISLPPGSLRARWPRIRALRPVGIGRARPPLPSVSSDSDSDARLIIGLGCFVVAAALVSAMSAYGFVKEVKVLELGVGLMIPLTVLQQFGVLLLAERLVSWISDRVENRRLVTAVWGVAWTLAITICVRILLVIGDRADTHWLWLFAGMQAICFIVVSAIPILATFAIEGSERLGTYLRAVRK
jgi:hypothetical protein